MNTVMDFDRPTRVIMHFREDELRSAKTGVRLVHYQVTIDPDPSWYDPERRFIRFNHQDNSEVHGWVPIDSVVIDSLLATLEGEEWRPVKRPDFQEGESAVREALGN
jgi:hypothetical protein